MDLVGYVTNDDDAPSAIRGRWLNTQVATYSVRSESRMFEGCVKEDARAMSKWKERQTNSRAHSYRLG